MSKTVRVPEPKQAPQTPGIPPIFALPLRLFLGVTFLYAGLQKLLDPAFFDATAPGSIGQQLQGFIRTGSPLSPLITHIALPHANLIGAVVAIAEIWIGLSTLLGLLARTGAIAGLLLSFSFFLTASWTVRPYFLGPDLPYMIAWLTLLLIGPGPYNLDVHLFTFVRKRPIARTAQERRRQRRTAAAATGSAISRSVFLRGAGAALILATCSTAIAAFVGRRPAHGAARSANSLSGASAAQPAEAAVTTPSPAANTSSANAGSTHSSGQQTPAGGVLLGNVSVVPKNQAGYYTDPSSGDPALLVHLPDDTFVAYDAVCTHAGCTVQYDPSQKLLVCPCHGASFDPMQKARVLNGPARRPLAPLTVKVLANGDAYAIPT